MPTGKHLPSIMPPINIFSNDGLFLEWFKKMKQDNVERIKHEEVIQWKKEFKEHIKSCGKYKKTTANVSEDSAEEGEEGEEYCPKHAKDANDDDKPLDLK
ncbi:hypothetical protein BC936DRAFT_150012, partial [Jimgerdemannia flammicorona]